MNAMERYGDISSLLQDRSATPTDPYEIYFAGGLFNHKELIGNAKLAHYIAKVSRDRFICNLPQDHEQTVDRCADVRNQDLLQVMKNDIAIFCFDGTDLDSGTVVEMVFSKMLDIPAVILRTDFRKAGDGLPDSEPWNLMASAYPRNKVLLINSIVWYQEALRQGGTVDEVEDRYCTRIATLIIEHLEAVLKEPGWLTPDVNVQEIYKAALRFPGAGLEKTPDSFLRSVIRRKTAKGLLPKESVSNNLIPRKALNLQMVHRDLKLLSKELQSGDSPVTGAELVLGGSTLAKCAELFDGVLNLDQFFGESLSLVQELFAKDSNGAAGIMSKAAIAVRERAMALQVRAETCYRESTFNSRGVFKLRHVSMQETLLRTFTLELTDVCNKIAEQAETAACQD
jgi:nucleoside 2-deoxyribosyltransferase